MGEKKEDTKQRFLIEHYTVQTNIASASHQRNHDFSEKDLGLKQREGTKIALTTAERDQICRHRPNCKVRSR